MELIVTSAIGCHDPHGLRLVKVQETEVEHATPTYFRFLNFCYLQPVGILTNLASNGKNDKNLHVFIQT